MALKRKTDRDVGHHVAMIMVACRTGNQEAAEHHRRELADARIIAAAKAVAAKLPELPPEKREQVRALLGSA